MNKIFIALASICLGFNGLIASETTIVENLRIENGYFLNFTAMDAQFEGIVDSKVASNFYEGLVLQVLESDVLEKSAMGRYRLKVRFLNPETQSEVTLTSKWMGGDVLVQQVIASSNQFEWKSNSRWITEKGGVNYNGEGLHVVDSEMTVWKINLTLEDGSSFIANHTFEAGRYYYSGADPKGKWYDRQSRKIYADLNIINVSDTIEILSETPGNKEMRKNGKSFFRLRNLSNGIEFDAIGDTHLQFQGQSP